MEEKSVEQKFNKWIIILSIAIPVAVAILFKVKLKDFGIHVAPLNFLPPIYATVNGITAILLVSAVSAIKNGKRQLHENLMKWAIGFSVVFLLMYVAYHMTADSAIYGDLNHNGLLDANEKVQVGNLRLVYIIILLTHIVLSIVIIPLVLVTYVRALAAKFDKHKKIARITFPIWLYVAVTGVVVYLMISPYYVH